MLTRNQYIYSLPIFVLLIGLISPNQWSRFPIGSLTVTWILCFATIGLVLVYKKQFFAPNNIGDYKIVMLYFAWMLIGCLRGMFVAEGYWEWKQWIVGVLSLSLPIFVYVFSTPWILRNTLRLWLRFGLPLFFLFYIWALTRLSYHFYLGPILLLGCFVPVVDRKWKIIFLVLLVLMLIADLGGRSQVIKSFVVLSLIAGFYLRRILSVKIFQIAHTILYMMPIVLLALGIAGVFNVFQDLSTHEGQYSQKRMVDGQMVEEDLSADTRTFIYVEVIESAIKHDYWLWGRTPARGNDSFSFGDHFAEELKTGRYERHKNEVCFPNIFTWLGLIGMILYCLIYLKSSYLAVYKSRNIFMKFLGVFIAFRFCYGWIEDFNSFSIMNISLWMMISMGFSESFRKMTNRQFETWVRKTVRF